MRKLLMIGAAVALIACGFLGSAGAPVSWPRLVQCAPSVEDVVGAVGRILLADDDDASISARGKRELEDLARVHGPSTIACLIERLVQDWTDPGKAQDPLLTHSAERGRAFLREVNSQPELPAEQW